MYMLLKEMCASRWSQELLRLADMQILKIGHNYLFRLLILCSSVSFLNVIPPFQFGPLFTDSKYQCNLSEN